MRPLPRFAGVSYLGQPHTADSEERAVFARSWPIGTTALWIAILLAAYVLIYYVMPG